jgi:hypothetical protein
MRFDRAGFYKTLAVAASSRCLFNDGENMLSGLIVRTIGSGCALCHCWPNFCDAEATKVLLLLTVAWSTGQVAWEKGVVVGDDGGNRGGIMSQNRH